MARITYHRDNYTRTKKHNLNRRLLSHRFKYYILAGIILNFCALIYLGLRHV